MPCYSPLSAWKPAGGGRISFNQLEERRGGQPIEIQCGQCIGCRLERSRQWAMRIVHESQLYDHNQFVTLTYDDTHVPVDHSLRYRDFQLFMKRLRKKLCVSGSAKPLHGVRFYMCGEYGENTSRPHYHACLFGVDFPDKKEFKKTGSGEMIYTSDILSSVWNLGHCSTAEVTFESAAYVARYVVKKRFGDVADENSHYKYVDDYGQVHYRVPEFSHMSLHNGGIGAGWFDKYHKEVYPLDRVVMRGIEMKPPKFYDKLLEKRNADMREFLDFERYENGKRLADDATPDRLRVREVVAKARLSFKRRSLE